MNWVKYLGVAASIVTVIGFGYTILKDQPVTQQNDVEGIQITGDQEISGGTFNGNVHNYYYGQEGSKIEYIDLLKERARRIQTSLYKEYTYESVEKYLKEFNILHPKHIEAIRNNQQVLAHEILGEIYALSFYLEMKEEDKENDAKGIKVEYQRELNFDGISGKIMTMYMAGVYEFGIRDFEDVKPWQKEAMRRGWDKRIHKLFN